MKIVSQEKITQLFETTWSSFENACTYIKRIDSVWLEISSSTICLDFAGEAMMPYLLPALAHLIIRPQIKADLHIKIWDTVSTNAPMVPPPWSDNDYLARGEISGIDMSTDVQVAYHPGSGILSMLHNEKKMAIVWIHNANHCPYYEQAAPLRTIFHWWFTHKQKQLVHGAAIGTDNGAVLLTGKGGSGKSTTALNCLLANMNYIGDDYVLCELLETGPQVHSLFNSAKITADTLKLLPQLNNKLSNPNRSTEEKGVLMAYNHFRSQLRSSLPLQAILIPQVTSEVMTKLRPIKSSLAFMALTPTTVFQLPNASQTATTFLRRLVMELPCYQLQLGTDLSRIPDVIQSAIKE